MINAVVGIISRKKDNRKEYLLISSTDDSGEYTGFYYPPGGHVEEGEDDKTALIREMYEELHVNVNPIDKIAKTPCDIKNQIIHWWICDTESYDFIVDKGEISNIGWFTKKDILNSKKVWPATKKFFDQYISD